MQTKSTSSQAVPDQESQFTVSRLVHMLQRYRSVILVSTLSVGLAYLIVAIAIFVFDKSDRVTTQPFRLDFEGAGNGRYPNNTKFSVTDIVSGPILMSVYKDDDLSRYVPFGDFSRSVYVLESNRTFERLAAEYQAKLADPRFTAVDRERLQQEFELKQQSIVKNDYAICFTRGSHVIGVPEVVARRVLVDIMNRWADFEVNQQRVTSYQIAVLSPEFLTAQDGNDSDLIASIEVIRQKVNRAIANVDAIRKLPGATQVRTANDHVSLDEVRLRLEEILRFRLEPLVPSILASGLVDRAPTVRFLQSQLEYDQRELDAKNREAEAARQALTIYEQPSGTETVASAAKAAKPAPNAAAAGEALTPQLSESFLDRLIDLTGRSGDAAYRQRLADEYRGAMMATVPLQRAVAYDSVVVEQARSAGAATVRLDPATVRAQIASAKTAAGELVRKMNELYQLVSATMSPSAQLYTITGPPTTQTIRGVSIGRLALLGVLVMLIAFPLIIVGCVLHTRFREEERAEEVEAEETRTLVASSTR